MKRSVILLQVSHFIEHYRMEEGRKRRKIVALYYIYTLLCLSLVNSTSSNVAFLSFDFLTILVLFNALIMIYFDVIQYQLYCYICIIFFGLGFFFCVFFLRAGITFYPFFFRGRSRKEQIYSMLTIRTGLGCFICGTLIPSIIL